MFHCVSLATHDWKVYFDSTRVLTMDRRYCEHHGQPLRNREEKQMIGK